MGWTFFSRWQENHRINHRIEQRALDKKRAENQRTVEMFGGDRFEILHFHASPGIIRRGETAQLCYGVSNAKTVRLEPQSDAVRPSFSRCLDVAPSKDAGGHSNREVWLITCPRKQRFGTPRAPSFADQRGSQSFSGVAKLRPT